MKEDDEDEEEQDDDDDDDDVEDEDCDEEGNRSAYKSAAVTQYFGGYVNFFSSICTF